MVQSFLEQLHYERARRELGFRIHLVAYLVGIMINWTIWIFITTDHIWPVYPTIGWSIGIISHYLGVYGISAHQYFERETEKIVARIKKSERTKSI